MKQTVKITDVEGCALGVIWQRHGCTAYEVRREFAVSTTPRWSASAGSIYPAIQRLLDRKLVSASTEAWGPRSRTRFSITARGRVELRRWIGPPFPPSLGGPAFDPLRTRSCFLGAMDRPARMKFVQQAVRDTREALAEHRKYTGTETGSADFEAIANRGSILELEARLHWLNELRAAVSRRVARALALVLPAALLVSSCSQNAPVAAARPAEATVLSRTSITPRADHHVHLLGRDARPSPEPQLPTIDLPPELNRLLLDRARLYANAKSSADLKDVFTSDAEMLSWRRPSRWVRGETAIVEAVNGVQPHRYRYDPNAFDISGSSGFIAGVVGVVIGETTHPALDFLLGVKKGSDGVWRIAAEATTVKTAPRFARIVTADELILDLDDAGIERAIVLSAAFWLGTRFPDPSDEMTKEYDAVRRENDWTAAQVAAYPSRLVMACSAHVLRAYAIAELQRCAKIPQARAFKLHFGDADVDLTKVEHLEKVRLFFRAANEQRVPIIVHFSPRRDFDATYVEVFLSAVMSQAPNIVVQIAHLGGDGPGLTSPNGTAAFAAVMEAKDPRTRNLLFDFAGLVGSKMTAAEATVMADRMRQLGLDRILYASDELPGDDANAPTAGHLLQTRRRLPLTDDELRTIAGNVAPYFR